MTVIKIIYRYVTCAACRRVYKGLGAKMHQYNLSGQHGLHGPMFRIDNPDLT